MPSSSAKMRSPGLTGMPPSVTGALTVPRFMEEGPRAVWPRLRTGKSGQLARVATSRTGPSTTMPAIPLRRADAGEQLADHGGFGPAAGIDHDHVALARHGDGVVDGAVVQGLAAGGDGRPGQSPAGPEGAERADRGVGQGAALQEVGGDGRGHRGPGRRSWPGRWCVGPVHGSGSAWPPPCLVPLPADAAERRRSATSSAGAAESIRTPSRCGAGYTELHRRARWCRAGRRSPLPASAQGST